MNEHTTSNEDEQILAKLRTGLSQSDSVPSDVTEFAKAALSWRTIDADLAELDFDSIDEDLPSGVRSSTTARMVSFQVGKWMLDVEYDEMSGRIMGHIAPESPFTVELHTPGALFSVESDEVGRFEADGIAPGPLSMVLRFRDGEVIKTQWVVL
ncbi:MAG TPA: hypothetical protein VF115_13380 [Acidimicrobiia bacterium]